MSDQKSWDAALIKTWRTSSTLHDAMSLFTALTGKLTKDCDPPLKRLPPSYLPFKWSVRVFVYSYLPKINDRLLKQDPAKDVLLLRKLETSSYDTLDKPFNRDLEIKEMRQMIRKNEGIINLVNDRYRSRNQKTDWGVVKGPSRIKRKRS